MLAARPVHEPKFCLNNSGFAESGRRWDEYASTPLWLASGENVWVRVPVQLGPADVSFGLTGFEAWVTDADGKRPAAARLYQHHWSIVSTPLTNPLCFRNQDFPGFVQDGFPTLPEGTSIAIARGTQWIANIHLMRLDGIIGARALRECVECYYGPGKGAACTPLMNGTFQCCGLGAASGRVKCKATFPLPLESYTLHYRVAYTTRPSPAGLLEVGLMAAPECSFTYHVFHGQDDAESLARNEIRMPCARGVHRAPCIRHPTSSTPDHASCTVHAASCLIQHATWSPRARTIHRYDATLYTALGHQHLGALNMSLFLNGERVCTASRADFDRHYLVSYAHLLDTWRPWTPCVPTRPAMPLMQSAQFGLDKAEAPVEEGAAVAGVAAGWIRLRAGDVLRLDAWYDSGRRRERPANHAFGGTHLQVMSVLWLAWHREVGGTMPSR